MIKFKNGKLNPKDRQTVAIILDELSDVFGDFYITKDNLRLFIRENKDLLFDLLSKGDKIVWDENKGIAFATGFAEKRARKYVKILSKDQKSADNLLQMLLSHANEELFIKLKKNNAIIPILKKNGFQWLGSRGREVLLIRKKQIKL